MSSRKGLVVGATGVILLLVAGSIGLYLVAWAQVSPPDLAMKDHFPVGFDEQSRAVRAFSLDGRSRCAGAFNPFPAWTKDGIVTTESPTLENVLQANPIRNPDYHVVGQPPPPRLVATTHFPPFTRKIVCDFEYGTGLWETNAAIANKNPVPLSDPQGTPFAYALTQVLLGGAGDGENGTRFLLEGHAPDPANLTLDYRVYRGSYAPSGRIFANSATPLLAWNDSFVFVFDIPGPHSDQDVELMLIPLRVQEAGVFAAGGASFSRLFRLEGQDAQKILVPHGSPLPREPLAHIANQEGGVVVYRGSTLDEVFERESQDPRKTEPKMASHLEVASDVSFLIQNAVEPRAKPGSTRHVQTHVDAPSRSIETQLSLTQEVRGERVAATHTWHPQGQAGKFVIRLSHEWVIPKSALAVKETAQVTAALTQIGADGIVALHAVRQGVSAESAVVAAGRALDAKGQLVDLDEKDAPRANQRLWEGGQKYFLAAAGLEAGWELIAARNTPDPLARLAHENRAIQVVAASMFSLTPQGALVMAATGLAEWSLERIGATGLVELLHDGVDFAQVLVLGKVQAKDARAAFADASERLSILAVEHQAGVLRPQPLRETPLDPILPVLAILGAASIVALTRRAR